MRGVSDFKIEKGIPLPVRSNEWMILYPFKQMKVGDSFLVPYGETAQATVKKRVMASSRRYKPMKFVSKLLDEGVRVWRKI